MLINVNMLIFDSKHEKVVFLLTASYRMPDFTSPKRIHEKPSGRP